MSGDDQQPIRIVQAGYAEDLAQVFLKADFGGVLAITLEPLAIGQLVLSALAANTATPVVPGDDVATVALDSKWITVSRDEDGRAVLAFDLQTGGRLTVAIDPVQEDVLASLMRRSGS